MHHLRISAHSRTAWLTVLALCVAALMLPASVTAAGVVPEVARTSLADIRPRQVLFVGNSYLYYNDSLHNHVRRMLEEAQPALKPRFKSATIGGARLSHHNLANHLQPGKLGLKEPFDLLILQGGSSETLSSQAREGFADVVAAMSKQAEQHGAATALYMTHAYVPPHARAAPGMTETVARAYIEVANELDLLVIPVGLAFQRAYDAYPDLELHKPFDGTHPSLLGTYLAACVVLASVWHASPVGLNYTYFGAIDPGVARRLQHIAQATVDDVLKRDAEP